MVGLVLRSVRVFKLFAWLEASSVKAALSRPAHPRVTQPVGQSLAKHKNVRTKPIITVSIVVFILVACAPVSTVIPTSTTILSQTATSVPPTPTATWWMTPAITATPLNVVLDKDIDIRNVIMQLHPTLCAGFNLAIETPPPQDVPAPYALKFMEINSPPDPNSYYFEEIADNVDNSRRAFIACKPEKCQDDVYVKDNKTDTVHKIDFGAMSWRPIQWLIWINKDTLLFAQSSNPHYGLFVAINVDKKEYRYYGMASDEYQCASSTPTP